MRQMMSLSHALASWWWDATKSVAKFLGGHFFLVQRVWMCFSQEVRYSLVLTHTHTDFKFTLTNSTIVYTSLYKQSSPVIFTTPHFRFSAPWSNIHLIVLQLHTLLSVRLFSLNWKQFWLLRCVAATKSHPRPQRQIKNKENAISELSHYN